jgi:hypothetical protein
MPSRPSSPRFQRPANVRLAAAAAGFAHSSFYRRRSVSRPFAREFRLALKMGYDRLECAMLQAAMPESGEHDLWRHNDPPPIPPLSADQALQLLVHHRKSALWGWDLPHRKRRRGEPWDVYAARITAIGYCEKRRAAEDAAVARALAFEETGSWRGAEEPGPVPLPPLHLVTGWSRASGRAPYRKGVALFGGWRIADMRAKMAKG